MLWQQYCNLGTKHPFLLTIWLLLLWKLFENKKEIEKFGKGKNCGQAKKTHAQTVYILVLIVNPITDITFFDCLKRYGLI